MKIWTMVMWFLFFATLVCSQTEINDEMKLPFYEIPEAPQEYTPETVVARMAEGLGYRYHWASEGLTAEQLEYKPSEEGRTIRETLEHVYALSRVVANTATNKVNERMAEELSLTYEELRRKTLENIEITSLALRNMDEMTLAELKLMFKRGDRQSEFSFWHILNGPLADAIYHTGQIVAFRRAAGNPINPNFQAFFGKNKD